MLWFSKSRNQVSRAFAVVLAAAAGAVLVAACGSSSAKGQPTGSASSAANPATTFSTAAVSGLGTVLVDGRGRTVYILTSGGHANVPCTDASGCTKAWPDLPLPDGVSAAKAGSGIKASLLGTMKLSDGETYPTYNGWLVYEYAGDAGPGQANGQGVKSFGGTWYALNASGDPITSSPSSSSGGGY